jgi:hypothetical protein
MMLTYQHFTAVLFLIYDSPFLNGSYYYLSVFWCAVTNSSWFLQHNTAPTHTALSVREFLASKQITVLEHPPYSSDLTPSDFFSVPEIKGNIERKAF